MPPDHPLPGALTRGGRGHAQAADKEVVLALPRLFLTGAATVHDVKDARSVILRYYESYPVSPAAGAPPPFPFPAGRPAA